MIRPPHKQVEPVAEAKPRKSWQKKPAAAPAAVSNEAGFAKKYGLNQEQLQYVKQFAVDNNLSLEDAAAQIALEEGQ